MLNLLNNRFMSKNLRMLITSTLLLFGVVFVARSQTETTELLSPDGGLKIAFSRQKQDPTIDPRTNTTRPNRDNTPETYQLLYEVWYNGKQLMAPSALGLQLEDSRLLGADVEIVAHSLSQGEDHYTMPTGRASHIQECYNALTLELRERRGNKRQFTIEARAYNDGVAFRYVVPKQPALSAYRLISEKTEYRLVKDAICYAQVLPNFRSGYESEFHKLPISGLSNQGGVPSYFLVGMPLLIDMWGIGWVAITEADMEGNSSAYLRNPTGSWTGHWFETVIAPSMENQEIAVTSTLPHHTPWRVIMVAPEPTRFIESNLLTNLNPPSRVTDSSWITSGKSSWDWWNGSLDAKGERAYTTEGMKYYVDFAAEMGLEYMTIDAGWSGEDITVCRDNVNVPEVVEYAKSKGVKVFIWAYSKYVWNQMDIAFPLYEKWGVAGIKIDFIERDDQPAIDFYYRVAEKAAQHKLMIDYHGATKTWGLQRTYPNVVGYEGIIGMEQSKAGVRDNPENRITIAFTRMLGGLADFTPGGFNNVRRDQFDAIMDGRPMVVGSRAHHLALFVVMESPYQMVSDWPEAYRNDPSFAFIRKVPASWDKTVALNGLPGEYITIARKRGNDWYLGALNSRETRSFDISLDFLEPGSYQAEIYADTPDTARDPKQVSIKTIRVKAGGKMKINMAPDGGVAIHFKKIN